MSAATKQVPLPILQAAAAVLESELQALENCCVDWSDSVMNAYLLQCRDLRDWLNANGVKVTEHACSKHQDLFEQFLAGQGDA